MNLLIGDRHFFRRLSPWMLFSTVAQKKTHITNKESTPPRDGLPLKSASRLAQARIREESL
jgi:hypothetical protein